MRVGWKAIPHTFISYKLKDIYVKITVCLVTELLKTM